MNFLESRTQQGFLNILRGELFFLLAVVVGAWLRFYEIKEQILADDEWHALRAVLSRPLGNILSHFGHSDYCIPLAALYKLLYPLTGLSEMTVRIPVLLFGVASLILLPPMVRLIMGKETGTIFAWLLAVSPMHIYFSRYARPYAVSLFLIFMGFLAFYQWWATGRRRWAVLYGVCTVLGPYFHLTTLPAAAAPLLFFLGKSLLERKGTPPVHAKAILYLGGAIALGWILLLGLPLARDFASLSTKAGEGESINYVTLRIVAELWGGTAKAWVLGLEAACLLCGTVLLLRRKTSFLIYLLFLLCVQWLALLIISPHTIQHGITLARYGLVTLPLGLLLLAVPLASLESLLQRKATMLPVGLIGLGAAALLFILGPLPSLYGSPNNWTNHALYQYVYGMNGRLNYTVKNLAHRPIPEFYHALENEPKGSLRIVKAPWYYDWHHNPYPLYQFVHKQWMMIGFVDNGESFTGNELPLSDPRLRFRNFIRMDDYEGLARRGVRYVSFHRDLRAELPDAADKKPRPVDGWIKKYRKRYGEPCYEDGIITVFDVAADRKEAD